MKASVSKMAIAALPIVVAIFGFIAFSMSLFSEDFSRPISDRDGIVIAWECLFLSKLDCEYTGCEIQVLAGEDIFGYAAPLENFIRVFPARSSGGNTVQSWADKSGIATYILPLFDEDGDFVTSLYVSRFDRDAFSTSLNRTRDAEYFEVKNCIREMHNSLEGGFKILQGNQVHIIYSEADAGVTGKISWYSQSSVESVESFVGRILTEEEIVQMLKELSRQ